MLWIYIPPYKKFYTITITTMSQKKIVPIWTKFWFLEYLGRDNVRKWKTYHLCRCVCWTEKFFSRCSLIHWSTKSCWCKSVELSHQNRKDTKTHWDSKTKFYNKYYTIRNRCSNPKDKNREYYWGKWIRCERKCYGDFKKDMYEWYKKHVEQHWEKNTTIERINPNWNYCKDNCRWATLHEQANNKTTNIIVEYKWQKCSLKDICSKLNKNYWMVLQRVQVSKRPLDYALRFPSVPLNIRWWPKEKLFNYFISLWY